MAFRRLKNYSPQNPSVDPRITSQWALNSSHCVVCVSPYPTLKELLDKDPAGIANTRMLGLLTDMTRAENIAVTSYYDIGDKNPIHIPGKPAYSLSLNSGIMECVNLLGGIYETVLDGLNKRYPGRFKKNPLDEIITRPKLNETYNESRLLSNDSDTQAIAIKPEASSESFTINDSLDQGAMLLSLSDIRLRIKFGLCFLIFQDAERLQESVDYSDLSVKYLDNSTQIEKQFNLMGGIYLENCLINSYSSSISANAPISSPVEAVNIIYNNTKNIQQLVKLDS